LDTVNQLILLTAGLLLLSILASVLSARVGMPLLLVFLSIGMLLGSDGLGGIVFADIRTAYLVGSVALAVILFDGGLRTEVRNFRVGLRPALSLATFGVLMTAGITGLFAAWVLGLSWLEGLLIGAIVGSTDAAAVFGLLHSRGLELKQRVGATLEIESGSNDPMAVFLTIVLVEALLAGQNYLGWETLWVFIKQMGLGAAFGLLGGLLLGQVINRMQLSAGLYPLVALSGGVSVFAAASVLGGSGFLAAYLAGIVLANRPLQSGQNILRFHDGMAWLAQISMFLVLGLFAHPAALLEIALPALMIAAVLMLVARPLSVWLGLLPFRFPREEKLFISWVGLRGAVPIVLALFPLMAGLENAWVFFNVAFFVVLVSLVLQGWTVAPLAKRLRLEVPSGSELIQRVELDVPGQLGRELVGYRLNADSPALSGELPKLPPGVCFAAILRAGQAIDLCQLKNLCDGDYVYLLATHDDLPALDKLFAGSADMDRQAARQFFGEFVINGEAHLEDVAMAYGFSLPEDIPGEQSIQELFALRFAGRQVVGDRIDLGTVMLVVREIDADQVTMVGLKLGR
jgi:cell volume regulation protein A